METIKEFLVNKIIKLHQWADDKYNTDELKRFDTTNSEYEKIIIGLDIIAKNNNVSYYDDESYLQDFKRLYFKFNTSDGAVYSTLKLFSKEFDNNVLVIETDFRSRKIRVRYNINNNEEYKNIVKKYANN